MTTDELQKVINDFLRLPIVKRLPPFLEIAGFPDRELVWENILAFFLDPKECHGFNELVLQSLFDAIALKNQDQHPIQPIGDIQNVKIFKECPTEKGRLDLLIQGDGYVVGIEIKVNADLYNNLEDYAKYIKERSGKTKIKVVLSLSECDVKIIKDNEFINLLWSDLIFSIKSRMGGFLQTANSKYTTFLNDFLEHVLQRQGALPMSDSETKQLDFMQMNYKAIQEIVSKHEEYCDLTENKMSQLLENLTKRFVEKGYTIKEPQNLFQYEGNTWTKFRIDVDGVGIWFQWTYSKYGQIWFTFYLVPDNFESLQQQIHDNDPEKEVVYNCFGEKSESIDIIAGKIIERAMRIIEEIRVAKKDTP